MKNFTDDELEIIDLALQQACMINETLMQTTNRDMPSATNGIIRSMKALRIKIASDGLKISRKAKVLLSDEDQQELDVKDFERYQNKHSTVLQTQLNIANGLINGDDNRRA